MPFKRAFSATLGFNEYGPEEPGGRTGSRSKLACGECMMSPSGRWPTGACRSRARQKRKNRVALGESGEVIHVNVPLDGTRLFGSWSWAHYSWPPHRIAPP